MGMASAAQRFAGFLVPSWGYPARAQVYCWAQRLTEEMISALLARARQAGYSEAHLLCHPEVVEMVADVCGAGPAEVWPVWARRV
jgi:hypothetical protein